MFKISNLIHFVLLIYFFLRLEYVNNLISSVWVIFLALITVLSIIAFNSFNHSQKKTILKECVLILIPISILGIYKYFDFGNFRLDFMIQYFVTSIPFFIIGFFYSFKKRKFESFILNFLIIYFIAYLPVLINYLSSGDFSRDNIEQVIFLGNENSGLIHMWPFLASLLILAIGVYNGKIHVGLKKILIIFSFIFLSIFILLSGYMSGTFFIIIALFSIVLFRSKIKSKFKIILSSAISISLIYIFLFLLSAYSFGATQFKSIAFIQFIQSGLIYDIDILNELTSNRWSGFQYSLLQFTKKPLFGHGIFLEDVGFMLGDVGLYTSASSGHSFFIDLLAYMGIFSIPIILLYIRYIKISFNCVRIQPSKKNQVVFAIFIAIFISNIANSILLFSAFDNFIFLIAGFSSGTLLKYKLIKHESAISD